MRLYLKRTMITSITYKVTIELYVEDILIDSYEDSTENGVYVNYKDKEYVNVNYNNKQYIVSADYDSYTGYGNYIITAKVGTDTFLFNFNGSEYTNRNHLGIIYYSSFGKLSYTTTS